MQSVCILDHCAIWRGWQRNQSYQTGTDSENVVKKKVSFGLFSDYSFWSFDLFNSLNKFLQMNERTKSDIDFSEDGMIEVLCETSFFN